MCVLALLSCLFSRGMQRFERLRSTKGRIFTEEPFVLTNKDETSRISRKRCRWYFIVAEGLIWRNLYVSCNYRTSIKHGDLLSFILPHRYMQIISDCFFTKIRIENNVRSEKVGHGRDQIKETARLLLSTIDRYLCNVDRNKVGERKQREEKKVVEAEETWEFSGEGYCRVKEVARVNGCVTNARREYDVHRRTEHLEIESQSHAHVHAIY